jgi:hypothetical protein
MGFMLLAPISIYVVETINDSYMEIPSTPGQTPATPVTRREATNYCIYYFHFEYLSSEKEPKKKNYTSRNFLFF